MKSVLISYHNMLWMEGVGIFFVITTPSVSSLLFVSAIFPLTGGSSSSSGNALIGLGKETMKGWSWSFNSSQCNLGGVDMNNQKPFLKSHF